MLEKLQGSSRRPRHVLYLRERGYVLAILGVARD